MKKFLLITLIFAAIAGCHRTIHEVAVPCPSDSCVTVPKPTPTPTPK